MARNSLLDLPEMKPTPRNQLLGLLADALTAGRDFADKAKVPAAVPMLGGQGLGSLLLGKAPEEVNEISYGNLPLRINPLAGRTASFVPEIKPGRKEQVADLVMALQGVPGGNRAALAGLGAVDTGAGKAMFIGPTAKTWDKAAAATAQKLEKAGAEPRAIWSETGTFKGSDGKWRQEISDDKALFNASSVAGRRVENDLPVGYVGLDLGPTVGGILEHQPLQAAYGTGLTSGTRIGNKNTMFGDGVHGSLDASGVVTINAPAKADQARSTTLHELQHAIQQREGFAPGGNPTEFAGVDAASQRSLDEINAILNSGKYDMSEYQTLLQRKRDILNNSGSGLSPYEQYRRLAGEAEARATQARMNMTPEQRRATFPYDSYDVPVNQLIVRGLLAP